MMTQYMSILQGLGNVFIDTQGTYCLQCDVETLSWEMDGSK